MNRRASIGLVVALIAIVGGIMIFGSRTVAATDTGETVVLIHGLARSDGSMAKIAKAFERAGFQTHSLDYASTRYEPDELVALVGGEIRACCSRATKVHFVTHSLGGILLRAVLAESKPPNLGRVVMLAPPNKGSEIVDGLGDNPIFKLVFGPTGADLGTAEDSFPNRLPAPDYDVGIIAGESSVNPIGSALLPESGDDGAVSIESTKLEGMRDHLVVDRSHTFIMDGPEVARQAIYFIEHGRFDRGDDLGRATPTEEHG